MVPMTNLTRAREDKVCKCCHGQIKRGDLHYYRGFDYTVYCLECYEKKHDKWKQNMEVGHDRKQAMLELLNGGRYSTQELSERIGRNYSDIIHRLQNKGYPIRREVEGTKVFFTMMPESAECVVCGAPFRSVTVANHIPGFLCDDCRAKVAVDRLWLYSRSRYEVPVYTPEGVSHIECLDDSVVDAIVDHSSYEYVEDVSGIEDNKPQYDLGSTSLSGVKMVHLAAKAHRMKALRSHEIALIFCIGLGKMWRCHLTGEQKAAEFKMISRMIETGMIHRPCLSEPCAVCEGVREQLRGVAMVPPPLVSDEDQAEAPTCRSWAAGGTDGAGARRNASIGNWMGA